jgi:hypothetical protein
MLKEKGLKKGSLYVRIDRAAKRNLITQEMATWAHQVRLEANKPRHADEKAPKGTPDDAKLSVAFAQVLAEFLFVLPAKVKKGIKDTTLAAKVKITDSKASGTLS